MDGASRREHLRRTPLAALVRPRRTSVDRPQQRERVRPLEGDLQALLHLSQSFSTTRNQGRTDFPQVLCPKSGRVCMTSGDFLSLEVEIQCK